MTLKNNRTPLLCYTKLCALFCSHQWIQTGATVQQCSIWVRIVDFFVACDLEIWRMTLKNNRAISSFVHHFIAISEGREHSLFESQYRYVPRFCPPFSAPGRSFCPQKFDLIVRRAGLLWSQQDFEWRWSVPLFKCLTVLEFSFILFDLCLLITFFNFIMNYVPIVTFWIFTYHKIWILSIMFCFIWSYWIIYFLACLEVSWRVVS